MMTLSLRVLAVLTLMAAAKARAEEPPAVTYEQHVLPLLREKCGSCHNGNDKKGGLVVDNYRALLSGGGSGESLKMGEPDGSVLYRVMAHMDEPFMPPNQPRLPDEQLALVRKWIELGAPQNASSKVKVAKPAMKAISPESAMQRPEGPAPLPENLPLEPVSVTPRPGTLHALAANPWSPLVAISGYEQVILYNTQLREVAAILPFAEGTAHVLRFSRNGSLLLAGGGRGARHGKVVVWDVRTGRRVTEVGDEYDVVLAADISGDQSLVALGGPKRIVRVYSTATGELQYELKKHTDWVTAIEFSPDSVLLATGDRSNGLFVWEAPTGSEFYALPGHKAAISDVAWAPDSNLLASGSEDGQIRWWTMHDGKPGKAWNAHGGGVTALRYVRDGRMVSVGRDQHARVWKPDGNQDKDYTGFADLPTDVTLDAETNTLVAGDLRGEVLLWTLDGPGPEKMTTNPPALSDRIAHVERMHAEASGQRVPAQQKVEELQKLLLARQEAAEAAKKQAVEGQTQAEQLTVQVNDLEKQSTTLLTVLEKARAELKAHEDELERRRVLREAGVKAEAEAVNQFRAAQKVFSEAEAAWGDAVAKLDEVPNDAGRRGAVAEALKVLQTATAPVEATTKARLQKAEERLAHAQAWGEQQVVVANATKATTDASTAYDGGQKTLAERREQLRRATENAQGLKAKAEEVAQMAVLNDDEQKAKAAAEATLQQVQTTLGQIELRLAHLRAAVGRVAAVEPMP